jgi:hypothetical protein
MRASRAAANTAGGGAAGKRDESSPVWRRVAVLCSMFDVLVVAVSACDCTVQQQEHGAEAATY